MKRIVIVALGVALSLPPLAGAATVLGVTVLQTDIGPQTTTAIFAHGASMSVGQVVFVFDDNPEAMPITAVSGSRVTMARGSPASPHRIGARAYYGAVSSFANTDQEPGSACDTATVVPWVVPRTRHVYDCFLGLWTLVTPQTVSSFAGAGSVFGPATLSLLGLGTTSTAGFTCQNTTLATASVPVQMSPRCGQMIGTAWDTAASQTVSFWPEVLPATAATPTGTLKFGYSLNGAAATYPLTLTSLGNGTLSGGLVLGSAADLTMGAAGRFSFSGQLFGSSPASGQFNLTNSAVTAGIGLDVSTDAVFKVRTRAQSAYAPVDALTYQTGGLAGVGAMTTALPANQTGNATATLKMNGLGAAGAPCTITPRSSGRVVFTISGNVTNSTILDGAQLILAFGTGAAPANAAAVTGTTVSATQVPAVPVAAQNQGFSLQGTATGLSLVATWFDLQISNTVGGTASVSNITCTAFEL